MNRDPLGARQRMREKRNVGEGACDSGSPAAPLQRVAQLTVSDRLLNGGARAGRLLRRGLALRRAARRALLLLPNKIVLVVVVARNEVVKNPVVVALVAVRRVAERAIAVVLVAVAAEDEVAVLGQIVPRAPRVHRVALAVVAARVMSIFVFFLVERAVVVALLAEALAGSGGGVGARDEPRQCRGVAELGVRAEEGRADLEVVVEALSKVANQAELAPAPVVGRKHSGAETGHDRGERATRSCRRRNEEESAVTQQLIIATLQRIRAARQKERCRWNWLLLLLLLLIRSDVIIIVVTLSLIIILIAIGLFFIVVNVLSDIDCNIIVTDASGLIISDSTNSPRRAFLLPQVRFDVATEEIIVGIRSCHD
jgi:hypothetical protein